MQRFFSKKAFTLIEMLIVIVIVGILAGALITKFSSIRDRANDLSRKSDLNQIAGALIAWQMDHNGELPVGFDSGEVIDIQQISGQLKESGLDGIPQDPQEFTRVSGLGQDDLIGGTGQYRYMKIRKDGIDGSSFVLMAKTETPGASNWVYESSINRSLIGTSADSSYILPCKTIKKGNTGALNFGGDCFYSSPEQLRFVIIR